MPPPKNLMKNQMIQKFQNFEIMKERVEGKGLMFDKENMFNGL